MGASYNCCAESDHVGLGPGEMDHRSGYVEFDGSSLRSAGEISTHTKFRRLQAGLNKPKSLEQIEVDKK